jgi:hypothetical protein
MVLSRRRVSVQVFIRHNRWVAIYLFYCLLAVTWSDYPFVACKRWFKLFGQPVMVLILLTEPDPLESLTRLLKRCAYVWIPVSVLFIKYFPQWGRNYDEWSGGVMFTGITTNKNLLGCDGFILGLFFLWHFLRVRKREPGLARRSELGLCLLFLVMIGWLLHLAQSSTSLGAFLLGSAIVLALGFPFVNRSRVSVYLAVLVVACVLAEGAFGIHAAIIKALGRNPTLTGRTEIWYVLSRWDLNPVIGVGFETFWLGDRVAQVSALVSGVRINEAHNGYLETYLNLGVLGVGITVALLWATYSKSLRSLVGDFDFGRFRLAYLVAFMVYNWTEAAFRTHAVPFFIFFLIAIDYPPGPAVEPAPAPVLHPEPLGVQPCV